MNKEIGQLLANARDEKGLTLGQVAEDTYIRERYLIAMEAGDFDAIPSLPQARGFLRTYANYLGLDGDALLAQLNPENAGDEEQVKEDKLTEDQNAHEEKSVEREGEGTKPEVKTSSMESPVSESEEKAKKQTEEETHPASGVDVDEKFKSIGEVLKHQREVLGLSLDDVEFHTHVRQHYLEALESGDIDALPSPVQGRGMLKNYAAFIGLDPDPLLIQYAEGLQQRLALKHGITTGEPNAPSAYHVPKSSKARRFFSSDLLIGISAALFFIFFILWGAIRIFSVTSESAPTPSAPSIADVLLATATPSLTPTATQATVVAPNSFPTQLLPTGTLGVGNVPVAGEGKVQIYISVLQRAYMRVSVDDEVKFDGRVLPGSAYSFVGEHKVEILTGNGAALQIFYNQQDLGVMGLMGEVVLEIYTPQGIAVPTPTITPTPTKTPRTTPKPTRTATPTPIEGTIPANP